MAQHLALYRKYRPSGFDALIGQEAIKSTLLNALKFKKVSHAYLFTGPRGTGKTSSAKILAKAINCLNPTDFNPCGTCDSCKDSNPDILEMDAASNNGVDEIRELRDKVAYTPVYGKYKVYIIDEVHMLTTQAFNALLKTLEEPPAHAVFILATTEPHKIPLTILSRCQRYDYRRIAQEDLVSRMKTIVEAEKAEVEGEALQLIAQIAAGGMRDALSLLDQAISHATGKVTLQNVINLTGAVDTRKIGKLIQLVSKKDIPGALEHFNLCFQSGQEPKFFVEEMMIYYRDILLFEKLGEKATLKKGVTDPSFKEVARSTNATLIFHNLSILQETMGKLKFHHDAQMLVEMAIVQMANEKQEDLRVELMNLKKEVEQLKHGVVLTVNEKPAHELTPAPIVEIVQVHEEVLVVREEVSLVRVEDDIFSQPPAEGPILLGIDEEELQHQTPKYGEEMPAISEFSTSEEPVVEESTAPVPVNNVLESLSMDDIFSFSATISSNEKTEPVIQKSELVREKTEVVREETAVTIAKEIINPANDNIIPFENLVNEAITNGEDWIHVVDESNMPPEEMAGPSEPVINKRG